MEKLNSLPLYESEDEFDPNTDADTREDTGQITDVELKDDLESSGVQVDRQGETKADADTREDTEQNTDMEAVQADKQDKTSTEVKRGEEMEVDT